MCTVYFLTPSVSRNGVSLFFSLILLIPSLTLSLSLSLSLSLALSLSVSLCSLPPSCHFLNHFILYSKRCVPVSLLLPLSLVTLCRYFFLVFLILPPPHYLSFCLPLFLSYSLNPLSTLSLSLPLSISLFFSSLMSFLRQYFITTLKDVSSLLYYFLCLS